jgi:nucleotide-binding universal stress UspA family protein
LTRTWFAGYRAAKHGGNVNQQEPAMYRSILVPLDGSPFGLQALPLALSIARNSNIPVHIVHVHVPLLPLHAETVVAEQETLDLRVRRQEETYLREMTGRIVEASSVRVVWTLLDGPIPDAIQEYALSEHVDLIVMSAHGRGPLSRFWLGNVADQLIRRAPVPTLLVRAREDHKLNVTDSHELRHILIPLDGSTVAEGILGPAIEIGRLMDADFTLLRIVEPLRVFVPDTSGHGLYATDDAAERQSRDVAQSYLDEIAENMRQKSLRVQTRVVAARHAATFILEEAASLEMSLIALQTHARRGLARLALGSVADKVLRGADIPVLICHPKTK